jgi:hypothetical protein
MTIHSASDQAARRAAKRIGLRASKTRWRANSIDNHGGFQLIDPNKNQVIDGERYDLSAKQVIDFCTDHPKTKVSRV